MKRLMILSLFLSMYHTHAQQLDDAFLDSLPEDVKEDLMKRSDEQSKEAEDNYRPSQYSSKLQQAEELIDLKIRIEADLRELEKRLQSDDTLTISKELNLFGSDFFNTFQTSFMPINEPNPDANYRLDVGDVLNIQITGQKDLIQDFSINGDGSINIPDIGKLVLVGLNISEASFDVSPKIFNVFNTNAHANITWN